MHAGVSFTLVVLLCVVVDVLALPVATDEPTTVATVTCSNRNQLCGEWARYGECRRNPGYMLLFCPRACCDNCVNDTSCIDTYDDWATCANYAEQGKCRNMPVSQNFALYHCARTCMLCGNDKGCCASPGAPTTDDMGGASTGSHGSARKQSDERESDSSESSESSPEATSSRETTTRVPTTTPTTLTTPPTTAVSTTTETTTYSSTEGPTTTTTQRPATAPTTHTTTPPTTTTTTISSDQSSGESQPATTPTTHTTPPTTTLPTINPNITPLGEGGYITDDNGDDNPVDPDDDDDDDDDNQDYVTPDLDFDDPVPADDSSETDKPVYEISDVLDQKYNGNPIQMHVSSLILQENEKWKGFYEEEDKNVEIELDIKVVDERSDEVELDANFKQFDEEIEVVGEVKPNGEIDLSSKLHPNNGTGDGDNDDDDDDDGDDEDDDPLPGDPDWKIEGHVYFDTEEEKWSVKGNISNHGNREVFVLIPDGDGLPPPCEKSCSGGSGNWLAWIIGLVIFLLTLLGVGIYLMLRIS